MGASEVAIAMQVEGAWRNPVIRRMTAKYVNNSDNTPFMCWARKKGYLPAKDDNKAMKYGRDNEPKAIEFYIFNTGYNVVLNGYFLHTLRTEQEEIQLAGGTPVKGGLCLGYSPDGLVVCDGASKHTKGLVEVKCPYNSTKQAVPLTDEV